jgi:hypothetical protein
VEATPFTVTLADGEVLQMRGGYYPLIFDKDLSLSQVINVQLRAEEIRNLPTLFSPSEVQGGNTITRTGTTYRDLVPELSLAVMVRSLNETVQDLAYREAINDVWRILKRPEVKQGLDGVFGDEAWLQMKLWLRNLVRGGGSTSEMRGANKMARRLRNNISVSSMGGKLSVMALQFTGISQSAQLLGWGWTLEGLKAAYGHTSLKELLAARDLMYEKSPQLAHRNSLPYDRDMYDTVVQGKDPLFKSLLQKWGEGLFKYIGVLDQMAANGVWLGAYQRALNQGKAEAEAVRDADALLNLTQAPATAKDMSFAQQGWSYGDIGKLATMFQTFYSSTINQVWLANRRAMREIRTGRPGAGRYLKALTGLARANWNLAVLPAVFSTLMWGGFDWPEDEEEAGEMFLRFGRDVIGNLAGGLPIIRDAIGLMTGWATGEGEARFAVTPAEGAVLGLPRGLSAAADLITEDEGRLKNLGRLARSAGPFVPGLPASQLATTLEGIDNWDDNDGLEKIYRLLIRKPK